MGKRTGIILAGGKSSRMGQDKALLPIGGKTAVERTAEVLAAGTDSQVVAADNQERFLFLGLTIVCDSHPEAGPLAGLEAGMSGEKAEWYIAAACDMPLIHPEVVKFLAGKVKDTESRAVIPVIEGRKQPLLAAYHRECLPVIRQCLAGNERSLKALLNKIDFDIITESDMIEEGIKQEAIEASFYNMNYPEEYEKILSRFG